MLSCRSDSQIVTTSNYRVGDVRVRIHVEVATSRHSSTTRWYAKSHTIGAHRINEQIPGRACSWVAACGHELHLNSGARLRVAPVSATPSRTLPITFGWALTAAMNSGIDILNPCEGVAATVASFEPRTRNVFETKTEHK